MPKHALNRTSPKGQTFIGTCYRCGKPNLPMSAVSEECENVAGFTDEEALILAVDPDAMSAIEGDLDERALDLVNALFDDMGARGIVLRNEGDFSSVSLERRTQAKAAWQVIVRAALSASKEGSDQ